jgi:hypothetical protein
MPLDAAMSPLKRHLEKIGDVMKKETGSNTAPAGNTANSAVLLHSRLPQCEKKCTPSRENASPAPANRGAADYGISRVCDA